MPLTDPYLKNIKPTGKRFEKADLDGMSIRVSPKGLVTFQSAPTIYGKRVRVSYGDYPAMSLQQARGKHREALELIEQGIDPRIYWTNQAEEQRTAITTRELCQEWYVRYALNNRKRPEDAMAIIKANIYPLLGKKKAKDVTRRDVVRVANVIIERGSMSQAHRVLTLFKQILSYGVQAGLIEFNPASEIKPATITGKGKSRERALTDDEIRAVWRTLSNLGLSTPVVLGLKLLLTTAQRRGELTKARWEDVVLDGDTPTWSIPVDTAKNDKAHLVPLSPLAITLFSELKSYAEQLGGSEWVLPSRNQGMALAEKSLTAGVSRKQSEFTIKSKAIPHWTPHDLRRTAATKMAELNAPPYVVEKILNHTLDGVMAIYNRYDYMPERREALNQWSARLELLLAEPDNVILIKRPAC